MAPHSALHVRGSEWTISDTLHVVVTSVMVLSILLAVGFGAVTLGPRFLRYSFGTLLVLVVSLTLVGVYGPRLAAHLPTPGLGIIERVNVYAYLLWVAVLAIGFLRHDRDRGAALDPKTAAAHVDGFVAPGFEEVRAEFERNFAERGEIGAAVAAYWRGEKVVDLWGGRRTPDGDAPWNEDTMVVVMSTTKGLAAMTLALANARGWLDYDAPVARYWPEFAQNGKDAITVRQLLGHEAGLVLLDEKLTVEKLRDLDDVARLLARQTAGLAAGNAPRLPRDDARACTCRSSFAASIPAHRTLGRFFHEEIAEPLGLDFYIGLPREIPDARLAKVKTALPGARAAGACASTPPTLIKKVLWPVVAAPQVAGDPVGHRLQRPTHSRGRAARGQRRRHRARDRARLFRVRRRRRRARDHAGDVRAHHGAARGRAAEGRSAGRAVVLLARLSPARARRRVRLEPTSVRRAGRGRLVRLRRSRRAPRLRVRDEQAGFLADRRSAREGAARRDLSRARPARLGATGGD